MASEVLVSQHCNSCELYAFHQFLLRIISRRVAECRCGLRAFLKASSAYLCIAVPAVDCTYRGTAIRCGVIFVAVHRFPTDAPSTTKKCQRLLIRSPMVNGQEFISRRWYECVEHSWAITPHYIDKTIQNCSICFLPVCPNNSAQLTPHACRYCKLSPASSG